MNELTAKSVFKKMEDAISEIHEAANNFPWENREIYANWLVQTFHYVRWTTRQLALASGYTKPGEEDSLHWRFIEEAKEEKRHEALAEHDLKVLGFNTNSFPELPHTAFFYQTLSYMIEREHPIAILGHSLTLEGYAAINGGSVYKRVQAAHGEKATTFCHLHAEVDVEHFGNALPYLEACPPHLLPVVSRGIDLCRAIYVGILTDIVRHQSKHASRAQAAMTSSDEAGAGASN